MKKTISISLLLATLLILIIRFDHSSSRHLDSEAIVQQPQHVDDRQWYRWLMRGGKIEPEKMVKARETVKSKVQASRYLRDAGMYAWSSLGPDNIGGRVRAIALQPDGNGGENLFVGAVGGGIWRSGDGGTSWESNNDFSPSMAVTSIVVHPSDPDILYASTGEGQAAQTIGIPGAGIFKSTDGGDSWSQLSATNNEKFYWVNKIAVNPENGDHLLAVTSNVNKEAGTFGLPFNGGGELYESLDGGDSWNLILSDGFLTDVEFHPSQGKVRVVSGHGTLKVFNDSNGQYEEKMTGNVNEIVQYSGRVEVTVHPLGLATIIYASINAEDSAGTCVVYRSQDGGATWEYRGDRSDIFSTSKSFGNYSNAIQVDYVGTNTIYLGGVDLWKSVDGGQTFTKISYWQDYHHYANAGVYQNCQLHADQHIIVPSLNYDMNNRKMYIGNDGGIQATDNISAASTDSIPLQSSGWDNLIGTSSGLGITQFYKGAVSPVNGNYGGGTQDNGIQMNKTASWNQPLTGDGNQMLFHPTDGNTVWINVNYNSLYKSTDGGSTFNFEYALGSDEAMLIAPMAMNWQNPNHIYLGGKALWRYDDVTSMATQIKAPIPPFIINSDTTYHHITSIAIDTSFRSIWVGYSNGRAEFSTDGGSTWSGDVVSFILPNTAITDIDIDPFSDDGLDLVATFGGYRMDNVWRLNTDLNLIWSNISLNFDMQVNTVTHHPTRSDWYYIGTDVGVFASQDNGSNWSICPTHDDYNDGPGYFEVTDLFWSYDQVSQVYSLWCATFGRGLFVSSGVSDEAFVDLANNGAQIGSRPFPHNSFIDAMDRAGGQETDVIFLGDGVYNEITSTKLFNKPVLIKNELLSNQSAIIE